MILIIISLIFTILTAIVFYIREEEINLKMLFSLGWLLIILFGCFSSVKTGEIGIKTKFGKVIDTDMSEGIHFKAPYEKIVKMNIKVQKYENKDLLSTSTKDMQIVNNIKAVVNFQVNGKSALELYKKVGTNYKEVILEPAIQETIKAVISKYTSEELVTKRSEIALDIERTLNNKVKKYGIDISSVSINNFDFSESYNDAIEKKAVAEQEAETSKNQLEKAKIDAEKKKVEAQAEAEANKIKENTLTDKILQQQFIEKWNGELPKVTSSENIFDISSLIK